MGLRTFGIAVLLLALLFFMPLRTLANLAFANDLYSHVILMPAVTAYLIWLQRGKWRSAPGFSLAGLILGILAGVLLLMSHSIKGNPGTDGRAALGLAVLSFVVLIFALGIFLLGSGVMRIVAFPLAMLLFMVPFPLPLEHGIEIFFQRTSAEAAAGFFGLTTIPVLRDGLIFHLPGISLQVAEECSGIRSSLVLFITSLIAGYLFLGNRWNRALLAFLVVPLGIVRNGFRVFTIGVLCVEIGPEMIHSPIHRRGGPIFFALSLIPFFLLLFWLRRREARREKGEESIPAPQGPSGNLP